MSIAISSVEKLVGDLLFFLGRHQDIEKIWGSGTKDELHRLGKTLSTIQAVLYDADEKQYENHAIKDWLSRTESVCCQVENLLQELSNETPKMAKKGNPKKVLSIFFLGSNQIARHLAIGRKVKLVRVRLDAIASDRHRLNLSELVENVLGRDDDVRRVTKLLLEPYGEQDNNYDSNVSFTCLSGTRGMGKTTLAHLVYNSHQVRLHFDLMVWVTCWDGCSAEQICKKIIASATGKMSKMRQMDKVAYQLKKVLDGRKYLLVLDDPWNAGYLEWMKLQDLLMSLSATCSKGSNVLIAEEFGGYATTLTKTSAHHHLERLSDDDSWALFSNIVFKQGQPPETSRIVQIGKEIVEQCAGVPLTIKTAGIRLRRNETGWLDYLLNEQLIESRGSHSSDINQSFGPTLKKEGTVVVAPDQTKHQSPLDENDSSSKFRKNELRKIVQHERFSLGSEFSDSDQTSGPTLEMEGTIVATDPTENQSPLGSTDRDTDPILTLEISIDRRWASFLNLKLQIFHFNQLPNTYKGQRFKEVLFYSHDYLVSAGETVRSGGKQVPVELSQEIFSKEASSSSSVLPTKINDISRWEDAVLGISEAEDEGPGKENVVQSEEVVVIKISSLPDNPSFPNLTILLFQKDKSVRKLADSFFSNMPSLQVLDLSETGLRSLPSSLFQLTALEALLLRDCNNLDNLQADIGDLRNIKALDLKRTELYNLPEEVNNLTKLEFLRVSFYGAYDPSEYSSLPPVLISQSTISNLQSLKALSIIVHPSDWRWKDQAEALTLEVGNLPSLTYLQFWFTEVRLVELFMNISPSCQMNTLCKFKFIVGQDIDRIVWRVPEKVVSEFDKHDRCLRYVNGNEIPAEFGSLRVPATAFYLDHHCVMKNLSEFGHDSFMGLQFCVVTECPEVVEIINNSEGSESVVLPNIQHLSLHYLWKLENLWKGSVPWGSLSCLKFLSVHACHKLEALFTRPLLLCLNNLKELVVEDCALLKVIIAREEDHEMVQGRDLFFPYMTKINLHYLPELTNVWLGDCPLLESTGISIIGCPRVAQHSGSSGEIVELNTT